MLTHNLGFPRIGANRELKKACEAYWTGKIPLCQLEETGQAERKKNWQIQQKAGIGLIPSNDFSFYDQVADWSFALGVIPPRFASLKNILSARDLYFALCRGYQKDGFDVTPLEMTKWFDTNYHYLVPEFEKDQHFTFSDSKVVDEFSEALLLGIKTKPVLLGPLSFLKLGKAKHEDFNPLQLVYSLLPVYIEIIGKLENAGADCIQIDEPFLVTDLTDYERQLYRTTFTELFGSFPGIRFILATYFGSISHNLDVISRLPLEVLHVDLVRAPNQLDGLFERIPSSMSLSLGVVDGRNIWKNNLKSSLELINKAVETLGADRVLLAPSCSLLHVPYDLENETNPRGLPPEVKNRMAFAVQKLDELKTLADLAGNFSSADSLHQFSENEKMLAEWDNSSWVRNEQVRKRTGSVPRELEKVRRGTAFPERIKKQQECLKLPSFPTTTIGSFPQTAEVRKTRRRFLNGEISEEKYNQFIRKETEATIRWQEKMGLDVLVHGEFERNDMVEFFGEQLNGFAFTQNGWVQSYGSRGVKPPVIYGDVSRKKPMTVDLAVYAQSLTDKPVKGMLTGPVTILQWSFVRDDQPRESTATQIALAIRDEVLDLEKAGIQIIQIDEPALREGLPLQKADKPIYLEWAVRVFKLSYLDVRDETQIHTHMCYAEFNDIIHSIVEMDADVISIETSRSQMELLKAFAKVYYPNQVGPGVYDIHSPRVPSVGEMCDLIYAAAHYIPVENLWVNPDCGLKTRGWPETVKALENMIEAAKILRKSITLNS
ncbi:MAG: 5-methyltetrahydropteroyltriglutamate--homocysteine S-methyltransferase [Prolixibacteraceae bacterium]